MKRRTLLGSVGASAISLSGCTVLGNPSDESRPEYLGQEQVVYYREDLRLSAQNQPIQLGDTVEFETTNTGDTDVPLGCDNPWALQYQTEEGWQHVTWTGNRFFQLCLTNLAPSESLTEKVTLSEDALEEEVSVVQRPLIPGAYRFVLIGPTPYLALQFNMVDS